MWRFPGRYGSPNTLREEAERLARASSWPGCPDGGWQYPFDFGHGIVARPYTPVQEALHPWRRKVLLDNLEPIFGGRWGEISVLDLGSCEGGMAAGLWERGVRKIKCIEGRAINVEKARFVNRVKGYGIKVVHTDVIEYALAEKGEYDLVLCMGLLYHLLNPFPFCEAVGRITKDACVFETTLALPCANGFRNAPEYGPSAAGFFIRRDSKDSNTAGFSDYEMWPTREGLDLLVRCGGFAQSREMDYGLDRPVYYDTSERIMLLAEKRA